MSNLTKVTSKGTELPLLNLKGKPYLQVAHRLVWFREDHPTGKIVTSLVFLDKTSAIAKADIYILGQKPSGEPFESLLSSAHKKETEENFGDFIEKAETGAIGRALAMAGYGTQFEPELDEGARLADSPISPAKKTTVTLPTPKQDSPKEDKALKALDRNKLNRRIEALAKLFETHPKAKDDSGQQYTRESFFAKVASLYNIAAKDNCHYNLTDAQASDLITKLEGKINE